MAKKKLVRSADNKVICGVLGGLSEYLDIDPTLMRICYTALTLCTVTFPGILLYIIMLILMPRVEKQQKLEE